MDEYLGNTSLLDRYLVAFFASRSSTAEVAERALRWAEDICQTDKVVISGFHSPLEKEVLRVLIEHKHPVILFLGRTMYKRVPVEYQEAIDEGRMLIDTVRDYERHSWNSAQTRNWYVAGLADEIYFAPFDETSKLSPMHYHFNRYSNGNVKIL